MDGLIDRWMDATWSYRVVKNEKAHVIMMVLQGGLTIQLCQRLVTPKTNNRKDVIIQFETI